MIRHLVAISIAGLLIAGCTPSKQATPTISPPTAAKPGLVDTPSTTRRPGLAILSLTTATIGSSVHVNALYRRADGNPLPGSALDFHVIVNSMGGARIADGRCTTDSTGQCSFTYRLGISPSGYYGSTIVFAQDAAGLQVSAVAPAGTA